MKIIDFQPHHLPKLTALYNDLTDSVPHCYPIDQSDLTAAFAGECGYEAHGERMAQEAIFVAVDGDAVGFVHVGEGKENRKDDAAPQGNIRFLAYPRGRRDCGQMLLERGEEWLQTRNLTSVLVYRQAYRYPFYHFSHAYLSNHLEHIQALLLFNGYEVCGGEVYLDWPEMNPEPPRDVSAFEFELEIRHEDGTGRLPDLNLTAHQGGEVIGECFSVSAGAFSSWDAVEDWVFTQELWVLEPFQGSGLGRYLLGMALVEAQRIGYRHAAISTALDNHRALMFYANCGYHAVDWTRQLRRTLPKSGA